MTERPRNADKTILVVEDDEDIRFLLKEALEMQHYNVRTAADGQEGLTKVREEPRPVLVLLDMMMPILDGREFLREMMADAALAPLPVVVVSATGTQRDMPGARAYLKKPADLGLLLQMVDRFVNPD